MTDTAEPLSPMALLVRSYIKRYGDEVSIRTVAGMLGLTVAQVSLALDELQAEERAGKAP